MKLLKIFSLFIVGAFVFSCTPENSDYYNYTTSPSITAKSKSGFIDLQKIDTEVVAVDVSSDSEIGFNKVSVIGSYGVKGDQVKLGEINGTTGTFTDGVSNLLSKFSVNADDVKVGDNIFLYFDIESAGTTYRDQNVVVIPFSCPSDLAGVYTSVTTGSSTDDCCKANPTVNFASVVTVTKLSDGKYQISDFSAGLYLHWYDIYGIATNEQSPGKIQDICGDLVFFETLEPFQTPVTGTGSVDQATKTITYNWVNGYGDEGTVVLTKQ